MSEQATAPAPESVDDVGALHAFLADLATALVWATRSFDGIAGAAARGCLPRIGDEQPPWEVAGWLLPYIMDLWPVPPRVGRWRYWLDTLEAGRLLEQPIPRLDFDAPHAEGKRALDKAVKVIAEREGFGGAAARLIEWLAWALHVDSNPPRLQAETAERLYRELDVAPLLLHPSDYLGWLLSEHRSSYDRKGTGFFPTPISLATMLAEMSFAERKDVDNRAATTMDPCVGTGSLLLAASNFSLRLSGCDIDGTCVAACKVQGAFYAPWMAFPLPDTIFPPKVDSTPEGEPSLSPLSSHINTAPEDMQVDRRGQGLLFGEEHRRRRRP